MPLAAQTPDDDRCEAICGGDLRASPVDPLVGHTLGERYRLDRRLGAGAMGAVYRAHHLSLDRPVAVKILHDRLTQDPMVAARFDREALAAAALDHPNCVQVLDAGSTPTGMKYLVMPLLEGHELRTLMGQPMPLARAVDLVLQILRGLEHAHRRGFVHRDVKPENVFVVQDDDGWPLAKLVDFGLVKLLETGGAASRLTRAGFVFGTPWYMAPEQAAGGDVDARADLYAVGAMMYEMLTGKPPFHAEEIGVVLRMHMLTEPPPLPASVPGPIAAFVLRLLSKEPHGRPAHARAAAEALRTAAQSVSAVDLSRPVRATPPALPVVVLPEIGSDIWLPGGSLTGPGGSVPPVVLSHAPVSLLGTSRGQLSMLVFATLLVSLFFWALWTARPAEDGVPAPTVAVETEVSVPETPQPESAEAAPPTANGPVSLATSAPAALAPPVTPTEPSAEKPQPRAPRAKPPTPKKRPAPRAAASTRRTPVEASSPPKIHLRPDKPPTSRSKLPTASKSSPPRDNGKIYLSPRS